MGFKRRVSVSVQEVAWVSMSTDGLYKWVKKRKKELGYKGCKNCAKRMDSGTCGWSDGQIHIICPKWERE